MSQQGRPQGSCTHNGVQTRAKTRVSKETNSVEGCGCAHVSCVTRKEQKHSAHLLLRRLTCSCPALMPPSATYLLTPNFLCPAASTHPWLHSTGPPALPSHSVVSCWPPGHLRTTDEPHAVTFCLQHTVFSCLLCPCFPVSRAAAPIVLAWNTRKQET